MKYGYLRVSTNKQTLENQKQRINSQYQVDRWIEDIGTGSAVQPGLKNLIENLVTNGDTIIVTALDRLGRSVRNCAGISETLIMKDVTLISIREGVDFSTPSGKMAFNVMISMAEFERQATSERIRDGLARAKSKGAVLGSPKKNNLLVELEIVQSIRYLTYRYRLTCREVKEVLSIAFDNKMSVGYLQNLKKQYASENLAGVSYCSEKLDSLAGAALIRRKKVRQVRNTPITESLRDDHITH